VRQLRASPLQDGLLRVVGTHHKTGTQLMGRLCSDVSRTFGLKFHSGAQRELPDGVNVWFTPYSQLDKNRITQDVRGVHVVRHPYQVVVSAYLFHRKCDEPWCTRIGYPARVDGQVYSRGEFSYQQCLNQLGQREGLLFEIEGRSRGTLSDLYRWDYADPRFLNVKFEALMSDFDATMRGIFRHLELDSLGVDALLQVARRHNVATWSKEQRDRDPHIVNKERRMYTYPDYLTADHLARIRELFPADLLAKVGYAESVQQTEHHR
jgi:hypothetical protein